MSARTYELTWLEQPALALETDALRFVTVPGMGAKIVSLYDKRAEREWLLPPINRNFEPVAYGADFTDQDMSGWDEMFPTTDACPYPVEGGYQGRALPDHGEVWALSWQIDHLTDDAISLAVVGHALPYRLTRTTQVTGDQRLRLAFEVVNTGSEPFVALWAAHPQFAVDARTRIVLPDSVERVVNVHPTPDWGARDLVVEWSEAQSQRGEWHKLDRIGAADLHNCRKFYVPADQPVTWAALQQDGDGAWIRLSWDAALVPYLGIWVDEGTYNPAPTAALEPTTGYYDQLERAWHNNRVMRLPPNQPARWWLDVELGGGALGEPT